jgi:hypothetical protein
MINEGSEICHKIEKRLRNNIFRNQVQPACKHTVTGPHYWSMVHPMERAMRTILNTGHRDDIYTDI